MANLCKIILHVITFITTFVDLSNNPVWKLSYELVEEYCSFYLWKMTIQYFVSDVWFIFSMTDLIWKHYVVEKLSRLIVSPNDVKMISKFSYVILFPRCFLSVYQTPWFWLHHDLYLSTEYLLIHFLYTLMHVHTMLYTILSYSSWHFIIFKY